MSRSLGPSRNVRVIFSAGALLIVAGCASTSAGRGWVDEPQSEQGVISASHSRDAAIPATAELEPVADNRPRLNHIVTLGEIDAAAADRGANGEASNPSVVINNYNVMNAATPTYGYGYGYGYAGRGYARSAPSFSAGGAPRTSGSGLSPGQNWPTISDHGPSFPLRSAPAGPWAR